MNDELIDDLIDDSGFDLGIPTPLEMAQQECILLHGELRDVWAELRGARHNITALVQMNTKQSDELKALKSEHGRVVWRLSERLRQDGIEAGQQRNFFADAHRGNS